MTYRFSVVFLLALFFSATVVNCGSSESSQSSDSVDSPSSESSESSSSEEDDVRKKEFFLYLLANGYLDEWLGSRGKGGLPSGASPSGDGKDDLWELFSKSSGRGKREAKPFFGGWFGTAFRSGYSKIRSTSRRYTTGNIKLIQVREVEPVKIVGHISNLTPGSNVLTINTGGECTTGSITVGNLNVRQSGKVDVRFYSQNVSLDPSNSNSVIGGSFVVTDSSGIVSACGTINRGSIGFRG